MTQVENEHFDGRNFPVTDFSDFMVPDPFGIGDNLGIFTQSQGLEFLQTPFQMETVHFHRPS
jgi:hypothetical protein